LNAAGVASYRSSAAVDVQGDVLAQQVQLNSGGHLRIGNSLAPVQVVGSNSISLQSADLSLVGGAVANASAKLVSGGGITVTASGNFVIQGGTEVSAYAELFATGPVTVSALSTSVLGGAGDNAYAKLDPALNSLLTINSGTVDVRGGSGRGAYGVIYSQGNIVINANSLSLLEGTGVDADAVVISQFGTISVPGNCNGCLQLSADPMNDGGRSRGVFQGGQSAQVANPVLVSTPLSQIDAVIEDLVSPPDNPEDLEKERQRQGDAPTDALTCS
jgi:hypothetical protein